MSLRDLAIHMMNMSDNAATDVVLDHVDTAAIVAVVEELDLPGTVLRADMAGGAQQVATELGFRTPHDLDAQLLDVLETAVRALAWMDPAHVNASTAREIARLVDAIWTDRAGTPQACALVRSLMGHQITSHRMASGFPRDDVTVASKTGTLPSIRNEAGVVTLAGGRNYVDSILTRAHSLTDRQPAVDAAIGRVAAAAVHHLHER